MRLPLFPRPCRRCRPARPDRRRRAGAALVIVLAFVVLLTGLVVAYFARALTGRQLSNSSAGQTRAALLAQSASDLVIAGLKTEIANGSMPTPAPPDYPVYVPKPAPVGKTGGYQTGAYAVPVRYPAPTPPPPPATPYPDLIPNLVRRSVSGDNAAATGIPSPAVPSLASKINSAADPAIGGRSITPARWNSHYLIPRSAGAADADTTPDTNAKFTAPDWVLVSRSGPAVQTAIGTGATALNNPVSTNQSYVVGRYAYAIYDEGGLLDMNVAGHPTPATTPSPNGFTPAQVSRKGSLAMADLTQLPTTSAPAFTQAVVDNIVGWRNYASGQPTGTFPSFSFAGDFGANWYKNFIVNNNKSGFLKVYNDPKNPNPTSQAPTDQAFLSRQQLLKLHTSLGFNADVLQYMGTFSRGLEQPSYAPDPNRPKIVTKNLDSARDPANNSPTVVPPTSPYADNYMGNNDAVNGDDNVNPSFLSVRVKSGFARTNGTMAVPGEPLVKTKFPLSRLAAVTYSATASNTPSNDPSTSNHIYDWFGIYRAKATDPWTYDHGANHIMTLDQVATAGRDPDFAELLKAAINVGSLGKGGPHLNTPQPPGAPGGQSNYQYVLDVSVDLQVFQIMANLIDQYDTDSYPTIIQFNIQSPAGTVTRTIRGVEDLPYFYRYHGMSVVTRPPSVLNKIADRISLYQTDLTRPNQRGNFYKDVVFCKPGSLVDPGEAAMLFVPEVWNPHDATPASKGNLAGPRPTQFRITASTDDPLGQAPWLTYAQETFDDSIKDALALPTNAYPQFVTSQPAHAAMTKDSTGLVFGDNNGLLFREPTLLWRPGLPAGSGLAPQGTSAGPFTDWNTTNLPAPNQPVSYLGMFVGKTPVSFVAPMPRVQDKTYVAAIAPGDQNPTNQPSDTKFVFQPTAVWYGKDFSASGTGFDQITFRIEYADPNDGHWIVYDEQYPDFHEMGDTKLTVNKNDTEQWPRSRWANPKRSNQFGNYNATLYDPRTARFGMGTSSDLRDNFTITVNTYLYETAAQGSYNDDSDGGNVAFGQSKYTIVESQRPGADAGNAVGYSNPCMTSNPGRNAQMRWFSGVGFSANNKQIAPFEYDGLLFVQNNPAVTIPSNNGTTQHLYYEDPDGVARRAMGAYLDTTQFASGGANSNGITAGQPLQKSNNYTVSSGSPAAGNGVGTPTVGNLARPLILNRPFQSVAEMSYAFRGTPWKQIDFFTPESGDTVLLDVFCVNEPPTNGIVAGKLNLNTHQAPVLKTVVTGAYRDELKNIGMSAPPNYVSQVVPLDSTEAGNVAAQLINITTDATNGWRGPLAYAGDVVGHYVPTPGTINSPNTPPPRDVYNFTETLSSKQYVYAGLSGTLDGTVYTNSSTPITSQYNQRIQRWREAAVRSLADSGQTRVWNLLIDVVSQTGRYPSNATALPQFAVEGEQRCWIHVAIDRFTGEVVEKQVEVVTE